MTDPVVLSFNDSLLRKSDVELLNDAQWLNDNIIGFAFEYVCHVFYYNCGRGTWCSLSDFEY